MPSSAPYPKSSPVSRTKADTSLMRDKNGCITCRVRQKKCTGIKLGDTDCGDCIRLNIQCLGVQHNRPDWLRNPDALKETKYRIKHHLTEYPVPRGRGPAPERPYLDFQDLIELYSPRMPGSEASSPISPHSTQLYRMEPESPTYSHSQAGGYLTVQPHHTKIPSTPSPLTPYQPMPLTPTSSEGGLFVHTDNQCGYNAQMFGHGAYMNQPDMSYHEVPYVPGLEYGVDVMHAPRATPYRYQHSESLFLGSPETPQFGYDFQDYVSPSARRQH